MSIKLNSLSAKQIIFGLSFILLASLAYINNRVVPTVTLNDFAVHVEIADTQAQREEGLSGRPGLANNKGMLFVFEAPGFYTFWMKDMRFDLDMIWINARGRVVEIHEYVSPYNFPETYTSKLPASYVLEVNGGTVDAAGLEIGDLVLIEGL